MRDLYPEDLGLKQFSQRFVSSNFDPTSIRPIVSAQQIRPKGYIQPSIEVPEPNTNSPPSKFVDTPVTHSPKRPFPAEDFEDHSPRKLARGESPLKGAAGRRMDQQKRQNVNGYPQSSLSQVHPPPPPPLPGQINFLLSIIPKASTYVDARFDPVKMVELMRDVRLPPPGSLRQPEHQPSPSWPPPPQFQHQQPPPMHAAFPPPGQSIGQSQYSAPFRYG
jgi:cleavage stimulation factor subunit 3